MRRSSAYPWTYIESLIAGYRCRNMFRDVRTYLMFIGQPRSGTSLVGSLLNAHKNMWIAQELNALRYVRRGYNRDQLYWLLYKKDHEFGRHGRQWTGYNYQLSDQWQGTFDRLQVIGDKKAGLSSELIRTCPDLVLRLQHLVKAPVRMIHIVRNPFNVITTIHRKRSRTPLPLAIDMYFRRCETNWRLMNEYGDAIKTIRLEQIIAGPQEALSQLCSFVGLDADDGYLSACAAKLFSKPRQSQNGIRWPGELVNKVRGRMVRYPFLAGYEFGSELPQRIEKAA